jgi:isoleucyl-tRNA synthetase
MAALATTKYVLLELAKLIAPFMPFIAENIWQKVSGYNFSNPNQSVHLQVWPKVDSEAPVAADSNNQDVVYTSVLKNMELARRIVEIGLAKRDEAGIKIRQKLGGLKIIGAQELPAEYLALVIDELNVEKAEFVPGGNDQLLVELDTALTPELIRAGIVRELVRFINLLRKEASLNLGDRTIVYLRGADESIREALAQEEEGIKRDTLSGRILLASDLPPVLISKEVKIGAAVLQLGLNKE